MARPCWIYHTRSPWGCCKTPERLWNWLYRKYLTGTRVWIINGWTTVTVAATIRRAIPFTFNRPPSLTRAPSPCHIEHRRRRYCPAIITPVLIKNVSQYAENLTQSNEAHSNGGGPGRQCNNDYSKHIHYDYDAGNEMAKRCDQKFIMRNGCEIIARDFCNSMLKKIDDSHLVMAKSMPDLPKVSSFFFYSLV